MKGLSDNILVAACERSGKAAYAVLVERYYRNVFALSLGMLGDIHDAEDLAQETMLRGFLKIKQLRDDEQFNSWILKIARNLCIDIIRRRKKQGLILEKKRMQAGQITKNSENYLLEDAIRALPQELRLPLVLYYFNNKNAKIIAEKLNISHSGVCQRIRAARKQLHKLLTEEVHDGK